MPLQKRTIVPALRRSESVVSTPSQPASPGPAQSTPSLQAVSIHDFPGLSKFVLVVIVPPAKRTSAPIPGSMSGRLTSTYPGQLDRNDLENQDK